MGCALAVFLGPLPLRSLANGPPIGVRFREPLVVRLHAGIDQIHLAIEAQCVTTLLPLGVRVKKSKDVVKLNGTHFLGLVKC